MIDSILQKTSDSYPLCTRNRHLCPFSRRINTKKHHFLTYFMCTHWCVNCDYRAG